MLRYALVWPLLRRADASVPQPSTTSVEEEEFAPQEVGDSDSVDSESSSSSSWLTSGESWLSWLPSLNLDEDEDAEAAAAEKEGKTVLSFDDLINATDLTVRRDCQVQLLEGELLSDSVELWAAARSKDSDQLLVAASWALVGRLLGPIVVRR